MKLYEEVTYMYLTVKQQLKHLSKTEYRTLKELSRAAKNLTNEALYNVRQHYFAQGSFLKYEDNYKQLKSSKNYRLLNSNMAQQILKEVDGSFKSFFGLLNLASKGQYSYQDIRLPSYLPKDGYATLVIGFVRLKENKLLIPYSNSFKKTHAAIEINIPPILLGKKVKEIRIIPKAYARFFEIQYTYEAECMQRNLNLNHALAIDLGVNNLMSVATSKGKSFIIDGRQIKSINQWYNKQNARLQSIKDKQKYGRKPTKRQRNLYIKHNNRINDYLSKAAKKVVEYCIEHDIGVLVLGYNETFQRNVDMNKQQNQNFVNIPFGKLKDKLEYLCKLNGISYIVQEESYTSQASFFDQDEIPIYGQKDSLEYKFSGRRVQRGLYKTNRQYEFNADVNGALNILKKSNVVSLETLYARGEVDTPMRIRIA